MINQLSAGKTQRKNRAQLALLATTVALVPGRPDAQNGFFADVRPLSEINSRFDDVEPNISADGLELFFDSNRPGGQGGWDLYVARRNDLSEPFGEARNVEELNTPGLDGTSCISADGLELYVVRGEDPGNTNMYVATRAAVH